MIADQSYLEGIFGAELEAAPVAQHIGLRAVFKNKTNVQNSIAATSIGKFQWKYQHPALCRLVEEFGVVSLGNAFMTGVDSLALSNRPIDDGMAQDVFHRDPLNGITVLFKPIIMSRSTPTYYARAEDVRSAINQIDRTGFSPHSEEALKAMADPKYSFAIRDSEIHIRHVVQNEIPDFTEQVFNLISADRKIRKDWPSNEYEVMLHSNREEDGILHGRPFGKDKTNILIAIEIVP